MWGKASSCNTLSTQRQRVTPQNVTPPEWTVARANKKINKIYIVCAVFSKNTHTVVRKRQRSKLRQRKGRSGSNGPWERTSVSKRSLRPSQSTPDLSFLSPHEMRESGGWGGIGEAVELWELECLRGVKYEKKTKNPGEPTRFRLICISNEEEEEEVKGRWSDGSDERGT